MSAKLANSASCSVPYIEMDISHDSPKKKETWAENMPVQSRYCGKITCLQSVSDGTSMELRVVTLLI